MPVYFATQTAAIARIWPIVLIATLGTLAGTVLGVRTLRRIPETAFRRIVAILLLLLGTYMLLRG